MFRRGTASYATSSFSRAGISSVGIAARASMTASSIVVPNTTVLLISTARSSAHPQMIHHIARFPATNLASAKAATRYAIPAMAAPSPTLVARSFSTLLGSRYNLVANKSKAVAKTAVASQPSTTSRMIGARAYNNLIQEPARQVDTIWIIAGSVAVAGLGFLAFNGVRNRAHSIAASGTFTNEAAQRIQQAYGYVAGGIALTGAAAAYLFMNGSAHRMVAMNPWMFLGLSVVGTIGSMVAIQMIPPEQAAARHLAFAIFNITMGASLAPLGFMGGRLIVNAMAGTGIIVGALSLLAASSPGTFMGYEGPLGVGLGVLLAASVGQMFFPSQLLSNLLVYGGLALFGGLMLSDTQRVITNAQNKGELFDPMAESLSIYLNIINIFVRMVNILADRQSRK